MDKLDCEQSLFCSKIRRENERDGMRDIRAAHADVVSSSSFRVSLRIFEQKRDCSQSMDKPSLSLHSAGLSISTSPTNPSINCDQGKMAFAIFSPQPCIIQNITLLSRTMLNMFTELIEPINSPALLSNLA